MADEPAIKKAKVDQEEPPSDDSTPELQDVVVTVKEQEFNCSENNLSKYVEYFKTKFFEDQSEDKDKPEVPLKNPETPEEVEAFLKVIKEELFLTDKTIERVLRLSVLWQAPIGERRFLEFLFAESKMTSQKFNMAMKLNSDSMKKQALSGMKSIEELHRIIPADRSSWDHATTSLVFDTYLKLTGWTPNRVLKPLWDDNYYWKYGRTPFATSWF